MDAVSLSYAPVAVGLGALHALEPGHAKTMTAAYLVGIHGRWHDAILLGLAAALTHSLVVIGIAVTAVLIGQKAFAGNAIWWLQIGSGATVALLGAWMLWRRLRRASRSVHHHDHGGGQPVVARSASWQCEVRISGVYPEERLQLSFAAAPVGTVSVAIQRPAGPDEFLTFVVEADDPRHLVSREVPREPHAFDAVIEVVDEGAADRLPFTMTEAGESHDHDDLDDDAHARAHAAQMPAYVGTEQRPAWWQVVAFGAAGGLVPCPASISVMLLALAVGSTFNGLVLVLGFSLGLALALVGVGLVVVVGLRQLGSDGRFAAISRHAATISAAVVLLSGLAGILMAVFGGHHAEVHA